MQGRCIVNAGNFFLVLVITVKPASAIKERVYVVGKKIPGGVTGDFFPWYPYRTMCPEVDSASESEYQGFLLG